MSVTVFFNTANGLDQVVIQQAAQVEITNTSQSLLILRHANGQIIGALTATNVLGAVADAPVMR